MITLPIAAALERRGWDVRAMDDPAAGVLSGEADVALTPPMDYASHLGVVDYALVPGVGVVADGVAGLVTLVFKRGLVAIDRIATRNPHAPEAILARLLLVEKHGLEPTFVAVPAEHSLEVMLGSADAALLVGDEAVNGPHDGSLFDIADEWVDLTESSMPYMIAWGRTGEVEEEALLEMRAACDEAPRLLPGLTAGGGAEALAARVLGGAIRFGLEPADLVGLDTLFRTAFYHGVVSDVASIKYLPDGDPADIPDPSGD